VALAFPRSGLWWRAYAGLGPVLLLVGAAPSRREAVWRCWPAGCGYFLALYHWLLPQLSVFVVPLVLAVGLAWLPWGMAAWWLLLDPRSAAQYPFPSDGSVPKHRVIGTFAVMASFSAWARSCHFWQ
jgi:apolipoprotein N-acyltransferase